MAKTASRAEEAARRARRADDAAVSTTAATEQISQFVSVAGATANAGSICNGSTANGDSLLAFLWSQQNCIKGSVDVFYDWLVSRDIDSIAALKEAVLDNEYLEGPMKDGCGSSGLKGFKCMAFGRAVGEYREGVKRAEITPPTERMGSSPPRGIGVNGDPPLPSNLFPEWEEERIDDYSTKMPPPSPGVSAIALPPSARGQNRDDFDGEKIEAEEGSKADGERTSPSTNVAPPAPAERQRRSSFDIPNSNSSLIDFGEPPSELVCPIGHVCFLSSSGDEEEAHQIDKSPCDSESWLPSRDFISEVCDRDLVVLL